MFARELLRSDSAAPHVASGAPDVAGAPQPLRRLPPDVLASLNRRPPRPLPRLARAPAASPGTADPPADQLPEGFELTGAPGSPTLIIDTAWLRAQGVPERTAELSFAAHPRVMGPILNKLVDRYPWAASRRREIVESPDVNVRISASAWKSPRITAPIHQVALIVGLPSDAPVRVEQGDDGLIVYAALGHLIPKRGGRDKLAAAAAEQMIRKAEETVGTPVRAKVREGFRGSLGRELAVAAASEDVVFKTLRPDVIDELFGMGTWRRLREASDGTAAGGTGTGGPAGSGGGRGAVITLPGGAFRFADGVTDREREDATRLLGQLFATPGRRKGQTPMVVLPGDTRTLRELAKDKKRWARLVARAKAGTGTSGPETLTSVLETIDEAQTFADESERLGVRHKPGSGGVAGDNIMRPVRGRIINTTGALVPGQQGRFEFQVEQGGESWTPSLVDVEWAATPIDESKKLETDRTAYDNDLPHDQKSNERIFEFKPKKVGLYDIHAFVRHSRFLPAHEKIVVEVRTEQERLAEHDRRSGFGTFGASKAHHFSDVAAKEPSGQEEGPSPRTAVEEKNRADYAPGLRAKGTLDEKFLKAAGGSVDIASSRIGDQIASLERTRQVEQERGGPGAADRIKWIDERLARLRKTQGELTEVSRDQRSQHVHCQGSYVGRTNRARGGPLNLACWFTFDDTAKEYDAHLIDGSELAQPEALHVKARGPAYEKVMERLFYELTKSYPDGRMSFSFQVYDGLKPSGRVVRFERKTDTAENDLRDVLKSDEAQIAVSIITALLSAFPPTMALGAAISLSLNAYTSVDDYLEAERTGTLKSDHKIALGKLALDVLPAARAAGVINLGRRSYMVLETARTAADVYLIATSAMGAIQNLRDQQIAQLASVMDELDRLRRNNESDPDLGRLQDQAEQLRTDIRRAGQDVLTDLAAKQLLQAASEKTVGKLADSAARRFGGGGSALPAPTPNDPAAPKRPAPAPDVPHAAPPHDPFSGPPAKPDPVLNNGLPAHLRDKVRSVLRDESLHDNTVRVEYKHADGLITEVSVRAGRTATARDIAAHARTVELMLGYRGLSGRVRVLLQELKAFFAGNPSPPPVGSLGWEAQLEVLKLPGLIADRAKTLAAGVDAVTATRLQAEIDQLDKQLERHRQTFERRATEAGRGFVAAAGEHHQAAVASGYPSLDKVPGHYYLPKPGGGYMLHTRADHAGPVKELASHNGRWILKDAKRAQAIEGVDLSSAGLRKLREALVSDADARAMAAFIGAAEFKRLSESVGDGLQLLVRVHKRVAPLAAADPAVAAGVDRLVRGVGAGMAKKGPGAVLELLDGVPDANLADFLRWAGKPGWRHPHSVSSGELARIADDGEDLRFRVRYGRDAHDKLSNTEGYRDLLKELRGMDAAAADKAVEAAMAPKPRKPPVRTGAAHVPDADDALYRRHRANAEAFFRDPKHVASLQPGTPLQVATDAKARLEYLRDYYKTGWKRHRKLSPSTKARILVEMDRNGREGGLDIRWINNARGAVAEALFSGVAGHRQTRIKNEDWGHHTQIDDKYGPTDRLGAPNPRNATEHVEIKSDLIDQPTPKGRRLAVQRARKYAYDGLKDWHAVKKNEATANDEMVIHFVRVPDEATQTAMLDILFAANSPFVAVGFAGKWTERKDHPRAAPMPQAADIPAQVKEMKEREQAAQDARARKPRRSPGRVPVP